MKKKIILYIILVCGIFNTLFAGNCIINYHIRNYPKFKFVDFIGEGAGVEYYRDNTGKTDGTFTVNIDEPMQIAAVTSHTYPYKIVMFWVHEGVIDVTIDSNMSLTFKNSPLNDEYTVFRKYSDSIRIIQTPLFERIYLDSTLTQAEKDSLNLVVDVQDTKRADFQYNLLIKNTASFLALNFLYFYVPTDKYDRQKLESLFNALDTSLYKYAMYKDIKTVLGLKHKKYEVGDTIDYLPLTDLNGNSVDFSSLLNKKYLYLINWATGCFACAPNNEKLKKVYKKLKSKLTIIGISDDTNKNSLLRTIKDEKLKWQNYCDFKNMLSIPSILLNCQFTPNGTLVAPNGIIIKKDIHSIKDVDKFVAEINALMK